eukprot:4620569-Amphidinium_carterae.1
MPCSYVSSNIQSCCGWSLHPLLALLLLQRSKLHMLLEGKGHSRFTRQASVPSYLGMRLRSVFSSCVNASHSWTWRCMCKAAVLPRPMFDLRSQEAFFNHTLVPHMMRAMSVLQQSPCPHPASCPIPHPKPKTAS